MSEFNELQGPILLDAPRLDPKPGTQGVGATPAPVTAETTPESPPETVECDGSEWCGENDCQQCCEHDELDHGFCLDCGAECDWVSRIYGMED